MKLSDFYQYLKSKRPPGVKGISQRTIRRWCEEGSITASRRKSGRWWIDLNELRKAFAEQKAQEKQMHEAALVAKPVEK